MAKIICKKHLLRDDEIIYKFIHLHDLAVVSEQLYI
jgi:hypothetical protein